MSADKPNLTKATPRPWCVGEYEFSESPWTDAIPIQHQDPRMAAPEIICWMTRGGWPEANAALIVEAVNNFDDLVSCLRGCADAFEALGNMPPVYDRIVALLSRIDCRVVAALKLAKESGNG